MTNHKHLIELLENVGFSKKEALVYIALLELNDAQPPTVASKTGLPRSSTYDILEKMHIRGLVSISNSDGSQYYRAVSPKRFLEEKREESRAMDASLSELEKSLPALNALNAEFSVTPQMEVFRGVHGLIEIMDDTLTCKSKEIMCWSNLEVSSNQQLRHYLKDYRKKRVERDIFLDILSIDGETCRELQKNDKEELRRITVISGDGYLFQNEINLYDDKAAIISFKDEIGVLIQNESIAQTLKVIFNLNKDLIKINA